MTPRSQYLKYHIYEYSEGCIRLTREGKVPLVFLFFDLLRYEDSTLPHYIYDLNA